MRPEPTSFIAKLRDSIRFHRCGWGRGGEPWFPTMRLGLVEIRWSHPGTRHEMHRLQDAEQAAEALREQVRAITSELDRP